MDPKAAGLLGRRLDNHSESVLVQKQGRPLKYSSGSVRCGPSKAMTCICFSSFPLCFGPLSRLLLRAASHDAGKFAIGWQAGLCCHTSQHGGGCWCFPDCYSVGYWLQHLGLQKAQVEAFVAPSIYQALPDPRVRSKSQLWRFVQYALSISVLAPLRPGPPPHFYICPGGSLKLASSSFKGIPAALPHKRLSASQSQVNALSASVGSGPRCRSSSLPRFSEP